MAARVGSSSFHQGVGLEKGAYIEQSKHHVARLRPKDQHKQANLLAKACSGGMWTNHRAQQAGYKVNSLFAHFSASTATRTFTGSGDVVWLSVVPQKRSSLQTTYATRRPRASKQQFAFFVARLDSEFSASRALGNRRPSMCPRGGRTGRQSE